MLHSGPAGDTDQTYGALGTVVAERAIGVEGPIREYYLVPLTEPDLSRLSHRDLLAGLPDRLTLPLREAAGSGHDRNTYSSELRPVPTRPVLVGADRAHDRDVHVRPGLLHRECRAPVDPAEPAGGGGRHRVDRGRLRHQHGRPARHRRPARRPVRPPPDVRRRHGGIRPHLGGLRAGARPGRAGRGAGPAGCRRRADGTQHPVHPRRGLQRPRPGAGDQRVRDGDGPGRRLGAADRRCPDPLRPGRPGLADDLLDQRAARRGRAAGQPAPGAGVPGRPGITVRPGRGRPDHRLPGGGGAAAGRRAAGGLAGLVLDRARLRRPARDRVRRPPAAQGRPRRGAPARPAGVRRPGRCGPG